jgi:hypothetical protein
MKQRYHWREFLGAHLVEFNPTSITQLDSGLADEIGCGLSVQHEAAVRRGRLCLHSVGRRDCRQCVRGRHGHVRCAGWQDRGPVIHRQDYAQGLKTRPSFRQVDHKPIKPLRRQPIGRS